MSKIISPIAIDMGAKNTGVYLNHFEQGEDPTTSGNIQGKTIVIDSTNITWSQAGRTQKRHQIRTNKRRKMSKRLLKLALNEYDIDFNAKQQEYLNGLLNRRGYTYLVEGLDESLIKQPFVAEYFVKKHNIFFKTKNSFYTDFLAISNNIEQARELQKGLTLSKNEAKTKVEENKREFANAYDNIKSVLNTQIKAEDEGHKYRAIYLENIKQDIENSDLLQPLLSDLNAEKLANLIGNISNLQLRVLRKYFNDKNMQSGDSWLPEKLHKVFFKWVRSWHAKQDNEKANRIEILKLKSNSNILDIFTTLDPVKTIPPYEDQNNRRPPKDLTLRLKPISLDVNLENWEVVAQLLVENYILPPIDESITEQIDIQEGLEYSSQSQKYKGKDKDTKQRQILADTLHRILDRTTNLDPYKLRWLTQGSNTPDTKKAKDLLDQHSNNKADKIIVLAKKYYAEVEVAKQGLWSSKDENSLFFRCDTNPPHKGKLTHKLVGHILREEFTEKKITDFREQCWHQKIKGNSTTKSLAGKIEDTRKKYGNGFNYIVQTIKRRNYVLTNNNPTEQQINRWNKYSEEHKDVTEAIKNTKLVAEKINNFLGNNNQEKYNNPYSIAQLYNHLESEITGFSKTDKFNTEENAWRDKSQTITILNRANEEIEITKSNAVRLTVDSIRPFDGLLDRIISRQAYEIASEKIKQIEALNIDKNAQLYVPIFMEQNRFKFEQDMAEIKSNTKKKGDAQKSLEEKNKQWKDKNTRIKKNSLCPYTGEMISVGEIDHIIPQSQSKRNQDVVFNSEANLIYCSGNGNHQKSDNRWTFEQLKPGYLEEVFDNETNVKQNIIDFVNGLNENDSISFHNLEEKEQNYLKHALFIPELDNKTFSILNTRYKTLVNGTQGYLGKQIRKLLQEKYSNIKVKTYQIPAQDVSRLRTVLGEYDKAFEKQEPQGAFSHVVDASLVLATALQVPKIAEELTTTNVTDLSEKGEWLKNLLPKNASVQHIKRKPKYRKKLQSTQIFKDGLYGERFMPIFLDDEKLYYGFALDNCHEIEPLKKPKKTVKEFDKKLQIAKEKQQAKHNEYFELLKPFLYIGKKNAKKVVEGNLSDNWQYQYLSIDKTKTLNHLQKCAKEVCSDTEIKQAKELEKLRYSIEKKKIKDVLVIGQGKKSFIKILNDKKFTVSRLTLPAKVQWEALINYPIIDYDKNETTLKACFGRPEQIEIDNQDIITFWQDLAKESGLTIDYLQEHLFKRNDKGELTKKSSVIPKSVFDKKVKEETSLKVLEDNTLLKKYFGAEFKVTTDLIPQPNWDKFFQNFFHADKMLNKNKHKQVRKEYSLPIASSPSGGFRIKRKNPLTGEVVYQVSSIEGFATKGYDKTLKNSIFINGLKNSSNIASLDGKQVEVDNVCYFDEWKKVTTPEVLEKKIISLSYAIGSKDRFNIRISMSFDRFKELDNSINYFSNILAEYKETDVNGFLRLILKPPDGEDAIGKEYSLRTCLCLFLFNILSA
jgi:CRISPR system subtype II-B RNA-guided endonuclease Cas9/Csx12